MNFIDGIVRSAIAPFLDLDPEDVECTAQRHFFRVERATSIWTRDHTLCVLCNAQLWGSRIDHCKGAMHKKKVKELKASLPFALAGFKHALALRSKPLRKHIAVLDQGGRAPWKDSVHQDLIKLLEASSSTNYSEQFLVNQMCQRVATSLQRERLVILSLAVWKAQCQEREVGEVPVVRSYRDMLPLIEEWLSSGWKEHKSEHRGSNAANIILHRVRPFIE
jgi:hypothetical protein